MSIHCCPTWCLSWSCWRCWWRGRGACSAAARSSTVFRPLPRASGYFRTGYAPDLALRQTRAEKILLVVFLLALVGFPFIASPFQLDLACQVFLASIGALS